MKIVVVALVAALTVTPSPTPEQGAAAGRAVLETGHVDIGPRYGDKRWTVQIHDDTAVPSVWRQASDTVLRVRDAAVERVPDDPAYAFLGRPAGSAVHVVPQTQNRDVVWIGWNTQDPDVMAAVPRGVTMNLLGVQGPGDVIVYLQSGNLGAPQVLWRSTKPYPQPLWVETNTHTHANWVFPAPGVYLLAIEIVAELADGQKVAAREVLRFAVGDGTSVDEAFGARFAGDLPASGVTPAAAPAAAKSHGNAVPLGLAAAGAVLAAAMIWLLARGAAARRRALDGGPADG